MMEMTGRRILVVEDEYLIAWVLEQDLAEAGATVLGPVGSVPEALELVAREAAVDGAILDVNVGGDQVYPVADALRARRVPFVLVTGYDERVIPARFRDAPRVEKPADTEVIARALFGAAEAGPAGSARTGR